MSQFQFQNRKAKTTKNLSETGSVAMNTALSVATVATNTALSLATLATNKANLYFFLKIKTIRFATFSLLDYVFFFFILIFSELLQLSESCFDYQFKNFQKRDNNSNVSMSSDCYVNM